MPTTPNLELPYPTLSDTADVPADIEALAAAVDASLAAGRLLAVKYYAPAGAGGLAWGANVWVCLFGQDPNLSVGPVAASASGRVLVRMEGAAIGANGDTPGILGGFSTDPAGLPATSVNMGSPPAAHGMPYSAESLIPGLTPGNEYTFYPWLYMGGVSGNMYLSSDGVNGGGFLMQVHSA